MWIHIITRGHLARAPVPDPPQSAIVASYDNELNMPSPGMCENGAVSPQKCPLSHTRSGPSGPPTHDWHTNAARGPALGVQMGGQTREGTLAATQDLQRPYVGGAERLPSAEGLTGGSGAASSD